MFFYNQAENFKQRKIPELPILCHNWCNSQILITNEMATEVIIQQIVSYFAYNFHMQGPLVLCSVVD